MKLGYCRVSTKDQSTEQQETALRAAGCEIIYTETASGAREDRPRLAELLQKARKGDTLVIWKLDRLARSLSHLVRLKEELERREIGLQSLTDHFDTNTASGKMLFGMLSVIAQFERDLITERVKAGLERARMEGKKGGRKKATHPDKIEKLKKARGYLAQGLRVPEAAKLSGLGRSTVYKYLSEIENGQNENGQGKRTTKRKRMTNGSGDHAHVH